MPSHPNAEWTNTVYVHIWRPAHQMTWQSLKLAHFFRGLECFLNKPFGSDYPPRISPFSLCMPLKWLPWEDGKPLIYPEVAHCMMARERECFILAMQRFPSDRLLWGYCIIAEISVLQTTVFNSTTLCLNTERHSLMHIRMLCYDTALSTTDGSAA